ncbi:MAG: hypothetical protein CL678_01665 [Bdellovibrionaceae bacterium]|nr:hypothetical protein [Pseudobdellovibrionaceae bacterium]
MKSKIILRSYLVLFVLSLNSFAKDSLVKDERGRFDEFDRGPDMSTEAGRGYAKLFAHTPNYRALGLQALKENKNDRSDKFRWKFGPMFYRGRLGKNEVKVLIIGQEGAQDENVSYRSFTGGTGGRMQNALKAMGIDESYLFINTFAYTIKGQYAEYAPIMINGKLKYQNQLPYPMLKLSQYENSPIVKHRNALIDHVVQSNPESLKLIIAVGGGAQDTLGTYILSRGGSCRPSRDAEKNVQMIQYGSVSAGGNRKFYFPVDEKGKNLLLEPGEKMSDFDFSENKDQQLLKSRLNSDRVLKNIVKKTGGINGQGLMDKRQLGTDLYSCLVEGKKQSLKGLSSVNTDVRFIKVKHPGSNSPTLSKNFSSALKDVREFQENSSWNLPVDHNLDQPFDEGFKYRNIKIPRRDFRYGLTEFMGSGTTRTTRRDGGASIELVRNKKGKYEGFSRRPKDAYRPHTFYQMPRGQADVPYEPNKTNYKYFDFGPSDYWASAFRGLIEGIPFFEDPYKNAKVTRPSSLRDQGFPVFRGRPDEAEVVILADQFSHDDLWTGRALTGYEGQKLQAFLQSIGVGSQYVILRSLPVDSLGVSDSDQEKLLNETRAWRKSVFKKLIDPERVQLIFTLGSQSDREIQKIHDGSLPVVSLTKSYELAWETLSQMEFSKTHVMFRQSEKAIPILRKDLPYGLPRWVGTAGDRVYRSTDGKIFKIFAPYWSTSTRKTLRPLSASEEEALETLGL